MLSTIISYMKWTVRSTAITPKISVLDLKNKKNQIYLKHIILPVFLVVLLPFIFDLAMSPEIIAGMLPGIIVSGMLFSSSATTSG